MWVMLRLILLLLLVALLSGCSGSSVTEPTAAVIPTLSPTPTSPPTYTPYPTPTPYPTLTPAPSFLGTQAPDFSFKLFQGEEQLGKGELRLDELKGTPIVLNFWARFCTPCWTEMPELQDFHEAKGDEVLLLGIDVGQFTGLGSPKDASKLLAALGVTYPAGYTDEAEVVRAYRVQAMPTTVFINAEGEVFRSWAGSIDRSAVEAIVASMLGRE